MTRILLVFALALGVVAFPIYLVVFMLKLTFVILLTPVIGVFYWIAWKLKTGERR
jgi:hypothetical protein